MMKLSFNCFVVVFLFVLAVHGQPAPCAIGAFVAIVHRTEGDRLQILDVSSNSPAARAGLAPNQLVSAIDGTPTKGMSLEDFVRRIQGEVGTKVVLEIEDRRRGWTNSVELTREVIAGDLLAANADSFDIPKSERRKSLSVTTNQVVRVSGTNGEVTIIQFTQFGTTNANYHWRSRPASGGIMTSGAGFVFEDCERHVDAHGRNQLIHRGSRDDLFVKAGNVRLEWSSNNLTSGWIYYYPSQEKVEVLDLLSFDSGFN